MKVALFGGTGFVGSYLVDKLISEGIIPRALVRKFSTSKISPTCELVYGDLRDETAVKDTIRDTEVIIYNIGIIRQLPDKGITYTSLHYEGVRHCIQIAEKMGVKRFILMSANGVKQEGTRYQRTKWEADEALQASGLHWTIFRPSLIFGNPRGQGRTEFCTQLRNDMLSLPFPAPLFYEGLFPINVGTFAMSPIHVENVAEFFVKAINQDESIGKVFNLGGTEPIHWKDIIHHIALSSGKPTWAIPTPVIAVKMVAAILDRFPWFPITRDQLTMLMEGNIVEEQYFKEFDIVPKKFNLENLRYLKVSQ